MTKNKFTLIKDENDNIYIVLKAKTTFTNYFNNHKYLNDKLGRHIKLLHKNRNWKDLSQASLDYIQLPSEATKFSMVDYKDLIFHFRTITGQIISIPLKDGLDADIQTILSENFNPSFFRTNFPIGLIGNHLADFVTVVLYELYSHAKQLDEYMEALVFPRNYITINDTKYYFDLIDIEHNQLILSVTGENGEPLSIDDDYMNITRDFQVGYYNYLYDETGERIIEAEDSIKTIQYYRVTDNNLYLLFDDNTFKLTPKKKVLIITITNNDDKISLIRFLSMNIEKQGAISKLEDTWQVLIDNVDAGTGDTINIHTTITDPEDMEHDGNINLYLEEKEED